jgi:hypothetical protein
VCHSLFAKHIHTLKNSSIPTEVKLGRACSLHFLKGKNESESLTHSLEVWTETKCVLHKGSVSQWGTRVLLPQKHLGHIHLRPIGLDTLEVEPGNLYSQKLLHVILKYSFANHCS